MENDIKSYVELNDSNVILKTTIDQLRKENSDLAIQNEKLTNKLMDQNLNNSSVQGEEGTKPKMSLWDKLFNKK